MNPEIGPRKTEYAPLPRKTELIASAATLLDRATLWSLFLPIKRVDELFGQAGYTGLQWMPLRGWVPAQFQLNHGLVAAETRDRIRSAAQSYRSEKNIIRSMQHSKWREAVQAFAILPYRDDSLRHIELLQLFLGRELPVVLQPATGTFDPGVSYPFRQKLIQPSPELMRLWNVYDVYQLIEQAKDHGYTGFCLDTHHFRELGSPNLRAWGQTLSELLSFTSMVSVSAGRTDLIQTAAIPTIKELTDLLEGTNETHLPNILRMIKFHGWKGPIVTKIPAAAIAQLESKSGRLTSKNFVKAHEQIVDSILKLVS